MVKLVEGNGNKTLGAEGGAFLHTLIDASIRKDRDYFRLMNVWRDFLSGKHWERLKKRQKEELKMVINLAHAHVRSLVPTLFFKNPSLDCLPTAPQHAGKEATWNALLNNTLDKIGFAEEMKKIALDAAFMPEAVIKDIINKPLDKSASESDKRGPTVWLSKGSPVHLRLNPSQLIVDYLVKDRDLERARFIAIRYRKTLAEIKNHPVYGKNLDINRRSGKIPTTGNLVENKHQTDYDWDEEAGREVQSLANETIVTIYEVWIHELISEDDKVKVYQQMCVLLEDQDKPLKELTPWDEVMTEGYNKYPVERIVLNPIPDAPAVSELETWKDIQTAINWSISRIVQLVENDRLLYACQPDKIKNFEKFKQAFHNGRAREIVEVTEPNAIELLQPSFVGRDNYTLINLLQSFGQQVTGLGQNRRGGAGIRTAREAHIIEAGTQLKTDEKVDTFEKFLLRVVAKTALLCRGLVKSDAGIQWVFRIGGDIGAVDWVNFTADDIDWIPEIRFRVNSFRKQDSMEEMQKLAGLINISLMLRAQYGPQIRSDILFGKLLQSVGIYDGSKIIGDQDAESMKQLVEIAAMIAGVDVPVQDGENHAAHHAIIESMKQTELGMKLMANPTIADFIERHDQVHIMKLQEQQQKQQVSQVNATNPFAAVGGDNENALADAAGQPVNDTMPFQQTGGI